MVQAGPSKPLTAPPRCSTQQPTPGDGVTGAASSSGLQALWVCLFVAGTVVPVAVVEERWLKGSGLGVVPFRGILAPWEVLVGLVLVPTLLVRLPGRSSAAASGGAGAGIQLADLPQWLYHGLECFVGGPSSAPQGDCSGLPALWVLFCAINVVWVLSALVITQRVSAAALSLATAVSLPTTTCLFQLRAVAGSATQDGLTWWTIAALVVTTAGFAMYRWTPEIDGDAGASQVPRQAPHVCDESDGCGHRSERQPVIAGDL